MERRASRIRCSVCSWETLKDIGYEMLEKRVPSVRLAKCRSENVQIRPCDATVSPGALFVLAGGRINATTHWGARRRILLPSVLERCTKTWHCHRVCGWFILPRRGAALLPLAFPCRHWSPGMVDLSPSYNTAKSLRPICQERPRSVS